MNEINFVNFAMDAKDKEKLDEVVKTVSQKPVIIPYKREAKFLRNFTLALMKQYKHKPKIEVIKKEIAKKIEQRQIIVHKTEPVKKSVPKIPNVLELEEFMPSPPKEIEIPLPEIKMPEAPHKPLTGGPIVEDVQEGHIPLPPKPIENNNQEKELSAPSSEENKDGLLAPPKFPL